MLGKLFFIIFLMIFPLGLFNGYVSDKGCKGINVKRLENIRDRLFRSWAISLFISLMSLIIFW